MLDEERRRAVAIMRTGGEIHELAGVDPALATAAHDEAISCTADVSFTGCLARGR
jgi:hypothetical protein